MIILSYHCVVGVGEITESLNDDKISKLTLCVLYIYEFSLISLCVSKCTAAAKTFQHFVLAA